MAPIEALQFAADAAVLMPAVQGDPIPNPVADAPPGSSGFLQIMGWGKWVALAICVLALISAGSMMALQLRRGEGGEHVGKIAMVLVAVIIISAAASLVGFLADTPTA